MLRWSMFCWLHDILFMKFEQSIGSMEQSTMTRSFDSPGGETFGHKDSPPGPRPNFGRYVLGSIDADRRDERLI